MASPWTGSLLWAQAQYMSEKLIVKDRTSMDRITSEFSPDLIWFMMRQIFIQAMRKLTVGFGLQAKYPAELPSSGLYHRIDWFFLSQTQTLECLKQNTCRPALQASLVEHTTYCDCNKLIAMKVYVTISNSLTTIIVWTAHQFCFKQIEPRIMSYHVHFIINSHKQLR